MPKGTQRELTRREVITAGLGVAGVAVLHSFAPSESQGQGGRGRGMKPIAYSPDNPAIAFTRDFCERCGECRLCCRQIAGVEGSQVPPGEDACIYCGQCTTICQGMAVTERFHYEDVLKILSAEDKIPIAIMAPSLRVSIGDSFGAMPGTDLEGKLVRALRNLGFKHVLDASFAADLIACEEAAELLARVDKGGNELPLFTSCCPAWVRFAELFLPGAAGNLSSVKSPILALATLAKTWLAEKEGIDPGKIVTVALAPCTAKKYERTRPEHKIRLSDGTTADSLDFALTTRETTLLLKAGGVTRLNSLEKDAFDALPGTASGAGLIFGATGGVCEAAVRAAWTQVTGTEPPAELLKWEPVRSLDAVRTAEIELGPHKIRVAVVHAASNARLFFDEMNRRKLHFDFVEVMACPGGCVGGGGQPRASSGDPSRVIQRRISGLYRRDEKTPVRNPATNPAVQSLYTELLEKPCSPRAVELLHVAR